MFLQFNQLSDIPLIEEAINQTLEVTKDYVTIDINGVPTPLHKQDFILFSPLSIYSPEDFTKLWY